MQSLPWIEPLELASAIAEPYWALLYSGANADYSGRYSYLACRLAERLEGENFSGLEKKLSANGERFGNAWFGYLGYGLKDCLESLAPEAPPFFDLPKLQMLRFHNIYEFDHENKSLCLWSYGLKTGLPTARPAAAIPDVRHIESSMTKREYIEKVEKIIQRIHAGDLYQANLTRKFTGSFERAPDGFSVFKRLCEVSPAPYSAYFKLGNVYIASSSPERFLSIDAGGNVTARPIKGTAPRFANAAEDAASRCALAASAKDRAENLMIVDLMRNDLARACSPGSVKTEKLFEVTTHATIHHMASVITGKKLPQCTALDVVKCCFPPGSMTGAPKIKAMNLCAEMEPAARGIYSGAVGWFGGDGSCDLSVAIRTLIIKGNRFEFQVGGGIVADSIPEKEFEETMHKAKGIMLALGLSMEDIAFL